MRKIVERVPPYKSIHWKDAADYFDLSVIDPRHLQLRDDDSFTPIYYLSWFRNFNEFRVSSEEFLEHWKETIRRELPQSPWLLNANFYFMSLWFRAKYRLTNENKRNPIQAATKDDRALILLLENPALTDEEIAAMTKTTLKTMKGWVCYQFARREMRRFAQQNRNDS